QRDHRLFDPANRADEPVKVRAHVLFQVSDAAADLRSRRLEVEPGAEVAALAGQDHTANRPLSGCAIERGDDLGVDLLSEPVLRFGAVERDPAHCSFVDYLQVASHGHLEGWSLPPPLPVSARM